MIKKSFNNDNPSLHVLSTPIGNLGDASTRLKETLELVDILLCEDTRIAGKLIKKLDIQKKPKLYRYDVIKENKLTESIIKLFNDYQNIGLVSDAGTPLISDPGFPLIRELKNTKINVVVVPGPVAYITALVASGFVTTHTFLGFVPPKSSQREKLFESLKTTKQTIAFYVSPFKLRKTVEELDKVFPETEIFLGKELTKLHETHYYGRPKEVLLDLPENIKGEYVLLIDNKGV